jgi:uncharacterized protein
MKLLFDVNTLIAFGLVEHQFHQRVTSWLQPRSTTVIVTTPITELGFVRVISQTPHYRATVAEAKALLLTVKEQRTPFTFLPDNFDILNLPAWVKTPKQITDGHLLGLAQLHGMKLVTLDEKIPGAHVIP